MFTNQMLQMLQMLNCTRLGFSAEQEVFKGFLEFFFWGHYKSKMEFSICGISSFLERLTTKKICEEESFFLKKHIANSVDNK